MKRKQAMPAALQLGRQAGFTLIEMVVVVAVAAVVMVVITGVMLNSFKAKSRVGLADIVDRNGNFALEEVRRNVINSSSALMTCPAGTGVSLTVYGADGLASALVCREGDKIASESAKGVIDLIDSQVVVSGCDYFVNCSTLPSGQVSQVNIGFTLSSGNLEAGPEGFVSKSFTSKVTMRD